jgi:hypothetical protein
MSRSVAQTEVCRFPSAPRYHPHVLVVHEARPTVRWVSCLIVFRRIFLQWLHFIQESITNVLMGVKKEEPFIPTMNGQGFLAHLL